MSKTKEWEAFERSRTFTDQSRAWVMTVCPLVFGEETEDFLRARMVQEPIFRAPDTWCIALDERFACNDMFHAEAMPWVRDRMSHEFLMQQGFCHANLVLPRLPLAVGAATRICIGERKLLFATRPDVLNLDRIKRWFGALMLAAEKEDLRSIAIPMPWYRDEEEATMLAATIVSETRAHHGNVHAVWPVFYSEEQRDGVLEAMDLWIKEDLGNFDSIQDRLAKEQKSAGALANHEVDAPRSGVG